MVSLYCESNSATISGKVASLPEYSHDVYGEGFYYFFVDVKRLSDSFDKIPVMISERFAPLSEYKIGRDILIEGQFRSHNQMTSTKAKLKLMVFARELKLDYVPGSVPVDYIPDEGLAPPDVSDMNRVELCGFVCKEPVYRKTPFNREIADLLIAVNRAYSKSDYIPCIAWGRSARFCSKLIVGDKVRIIGRIQSRVYQKKLPDGTVEEKVAYELSVIRLELIREYQNARRLKYEAMRRAERDENAETEYSSERKVDNF